MRAPLPLEGEFSNVWSKIEKVIDPLHVKNHKVILVFHTFTMTSIVCILKRYPHLFQRPECKEIYAPAKVSEKYPEANLMIAEQTFAWMG
jgi:hypothetical protein